MLSNEQEITDLSTINTHTHIYQFHLHLYVEKQNISEDSICNFLNDLTVLSLTMEQSLSCEGNLTEKETYNSLISLENNKSPGNDGLTKEFYWTFWDDIKDKDKRYISNWQPISSLNFDLKMISQTLDTRVKKVLSNLIDSRQTTYVNERFIGETSCLIDDVIKVCDI